MSEFIGIILPALVSMITTFVVTAPVFIKTRNDRMRDVKDIERQYRMDVEELRQKEVEREGKYQEMSRRCCEDLSKKNFEVEQLRTELDKQHDDIKKLKSEQDRMLLTEKEHQEYIELLEQAIEMLSEQIKKLGQEPIIKHKRRAKK